MSLKTSITDREYNKFLEYPGTGDHCVRVRVENLTTEAIPIDGAIGIAAPTGPFKVTTVTANDTAANPLPVPLVNRVSLSIRNKSITTTVYIGPLNTVTADDNASTGGWEIGPGEDMHIDLDDGNLFYFITPATETAIVKILEIASTASGGGGGSSLTAIQEVPSGVIDGLNVTFTVSQIPDSSGSFLLFLDGLYQTPGIDYTRSGVTITMTTAPATGQTLNAFYEY